MQTGETAWNPTGVGKVSLCAGLHGGRWSHKVVEIFQDFCSFSGLPFLRCRRIMFCWAGIVFASVSAVDASEIWVVSVGGQVLLSRWPCKLVRAFSFETNPSLVRPLS